MLNFSISYWDFIECLYFVDTTEREDRGWKEPQRQGEDRVTLWITLLYKPFNGVPMAVPMHMFVFSLSSCSTNKIRIQICCSAKSVKVWMQLLRNFESKAPSIDTFSLFQNRTNCTNRKQEHKSLYRIPQLEMCSWYLLHEDWPLSGVSRKHTSKLLTNTAWKI